MDQRGHRHGRRVEAMAEGPEERSLCAWWRSCSSSKRPKSSSSFKWNSGQQLLTMSSIMACPLERLDKGSSPFWVGALWHLLSGFFGMRTGNLQCYCNVYHCVFQLYCIALLAEQTVSTVMFYQSHLCDCHTVMSILTCFLLYRIHTLPHTGGRGKIFGIEQESAIVDMVVANNAIRLQAAVIADQGAFRNINSVSLATIDRVLKRNHVRMKQRYRVPFQRNSDIVKEAWFQYVQVQIFIVIPVYHSYMQLE